MRIDGREHGHGFVRAEGGTPFACATVTRSSREVEAGFHDFAIMKTDGIGDSSTTCRTSTRRCRRRPTASWQPAWRRPGGSRAGR